MSDRKYRQRGYQDSGGERKGPHTGPKPPLAKPPVINDRIETRADKAERKALEGRAPSVPGFHEVMRCARCGNIFTESILSLSQCKRCGADLRSCAQCESFDPGATYECRQKIPVRISPKDAKNTCTLFSARVQVERETGSTPAAPSRQSSGARKAFDDLFKI